MQLARLRRCGLAAALCAAGLAHAGTPTLELAVKANFVAKFPAYVGWAAPHSPMSLCLVGDAPFGRLIDDAVAGQSIDGRSVAVRRLGVLAADSGCDIAFVAGSQQQSVRAGLALGARGTLTITDQRRGSDRGIIHFVVAGGRVRFHIDEAAAGRRDLTISSKLLSLALSVVPREVR